MKKEIKTLLESIKEKNIRNFLCILNNIKKEDLELLDEQKGMNVVHFCAQENSARELLLIISHITELDLNIKSKGIVQKTALQLALSLKNAEVAAILVKSGASLENVNIKEIKKEFKNDTFLIEAIEEFNNLHSQQKKKRFFSFF
jgi:predicted hydrolase (HD superfamily)